MIEKEAVHRFARDLAALVPAPAGPLAVAVSGGPDSLALLLLAEAAFPGRVRAATVDHRLRPESAGEAAFVARICADRGIPHDILDASVARAGEGLQAAAREARYAVLTAWMRERGLAWLLTAHHADDQAETLLMRLNRGSGVAGLAGIRARTPFDDAVLVRPLLGWRRDELAALVRVEGLTPIDDPSNADPAYDRVRVRRRLAEAPWLDPAALARSAAALAEAEEALTAAAATLAAERLRRDGAGWRLDPRGLPREILRRLVTAALTGAAPRGEQVSALLADLEAGRTVTLAGVKCSGGAEWRFAPAPPRRTG
ncbi:MAG: tRNA lysidine(34) synthetase TilS [Allosphingosinicella sp.]